jgi:hypothetical protein
MSGSFWYETKFFLNIGIVFSDVILLNPVKANTGRRSSFDNEKRFRCEQFCKNRDWRCRQRAYNKKKERIKRKAAGICNSFFIDCMNRCQRYSR